MCIRKQRDHTMCHMFAYKRLKINKLKIIKLSVSEKWLRPLTRGINLWEVYWVLTGKSWVFCIL